MKNPGYQNNVVHQNPNNPIYQYPEFPTTSSGKFLFHFPYVSFIASPQLNFNISQGSYGSLFNFKSSITVEIIFKKRLIFKEKGNPLRP